MYLKRKPCWQTSVQRPSSSSGAPFSVPFPHSSPHAQGVLGELSYESDAAERLRGELRAAHAEAGQLRGRLQDDAARLTAAEQVLFKHAASFAWAAF